MVSGLEGKVVIVTGASSGLGAELAAWLDDAGVKLVLAARRAERLRDLCRRLGGEPTAVVCDVTDDADRERLIAAATEAHGRIDGLVNNAGISKVATAMKEPVEDFRAHLETNLVAPFALSQLVARVMRDHGGGSIVNVASVLGLRSSANMPEAGYVSSKGALIALTRELASQWGRHGIRVNAVAPGFFPSEMTEGLADEAGDAPDWLAAATPLARLGRPGELAPAIAYLLADMSSFVTGQTTVVDGGIATR
ncbi:MAG TPA: glucose 1-dehydrogenase [Solirubrobacterales bacterium]|nr:glucose 1-dehydrogenase [Solirubrobacterales bacterium]